MSYKINVLEACCAEFFISGLSPRSSSSSEWRSTAWKPSPSCPGSCSWPLAAACTRLASLMDWSQAGSCRCEQNTPCPDR